MILLMGIAGSGKGTQGKRLADLHNLRIISMGDVLRMYITGHQRDNMLAGQLLNDNEIIEIVDKVLRSIPPNEEVIVDGFPRTIPQAKWLLDQANQGRFKINVAINLQASRNAVKKRLIRRARIDDKEDAIEARFKEYETSTLPLIDWLSVNNIKVIDVNAERTVEDVNDDLVKILKDINIAK